MSITCERCGLPLGGRASGYMRHYNNCRRLPTPDELADEYNADDNMRIVDLAKKHGLSYQHMHTRLRLSKRYKVRKIHRGPKEVLYDGPRCAVCEIRLDLCGDNDGLCDVCAGKERKYIPLTIQEAYERAVYTRQVEIV